MSDAAGFHRAIHDNPNDRTNVLVYADWLEDHGKPGIASILRKHVETGIHPVHPDIYNESNREDYLLEPGQFGVGSHVLRLRSEAEPTMTLKWHLRPRTEDKTQMNSDRISLLEQLISEGVKPTRVARYLRTYARGKR